MSLSGAGWRFLLSARGVVFFVMAMACAGRLAGQSASYETIQNLIGPLDGLYPAAPVIQGSDGNFYGTTEAGGSYSSGTVFKMTPTGGLTTLYSFTGGADGASPQGGLTQGSDGNFYGTACYGGDTNGDGTVFKITPSGVLTTLYTFSGTQNGGYDGSHPIGALALGSDGNFYGVTKDGGNTDEYGYTFGTVFKITPAGVYTSLTSYLGFEAGKPTSGLIQGSDGNFYGATGAGDPFDGDSYGTVFQMTPSGSATTLYSFGGSESGGPASGYPSGVIQGSDGNFYGPTFIGGNGNRLGTVFQLTPGGVLTTLYAFTGGADGEHPYASLALGRDGNFYGTTEFGDDTADACTIFQITPAGALTTLYTFTNYAGGANPIAALTLGADGNFYGTTEYGGVNNGGASGSGGGTVFQVTPAGVLTNLHTFTGGGAPQQAGLTLGNDGNFYGVTSGSDGTDGFGSFFQLTPAGVLTTLYAFPGGAGGATPLGPLTLGSDGNFYGTTYYGGDSNGDGTIFKITPAGVLTTLHIFTGGAGGSKPETALAEGSDGNFYGTTIAGGVTDEFGDTGTIFKITPSGDFSVLYTFTGGGDGYGPYSGLTLGSDGNFYGTTRYGGISTEYGSYGTFFKITPAGGFTTIHAFTGSGYNLFAMCSRLIQAGDGNFYGTTLDSIFKITPAGVFTNLYTIPNDVDGASYIGLTLGSDGNFYGTTDYGDLGSAFEITPAGVFTTLYTFTLGADGYCPEGNLIEASDGSFYGLTSRGGQYRSGAIYRLALAPPAVTGGTANALLNSAFSYQIAATNAPTSFGASNLPAGLRVNAATGRISGTPTQSGIFSVGLSAANLGGTGTAALTLTVRPPPPAITSATTETGQVGKAYSYKIGGTNDPTSFGASGLPAGLTINAATGLISGTPTQPGSFSVNLRASNLGGSGVATLNLTILPAAPAITSATTESGQAGKAFSYKIGATNDPTSFGASGLPAGLSINATTGLISGTPTKAGSYPVNLRASNAGGSGLATLTLTILPAAPVITSATSASAQVGKAFSYQIAATNAPTSFGAGGLPAGLTASGTSGLISGTPTKAGSYSVNLRASNSGGSGLATLTLTVSAGM